MKVNIDANQFKTIEVPVSVMGEASGTVYTGPRGQGRILVCFYRNDSTLAARTLTESDGYYSYLGLKPGKYIARIDPEQLKKIKMTSSPELIPVDINPNRDGDIVEGLDFKLSSLNKEPVADTTLATNQVKPVSPAATTEISAKPADKVANVPETKTPGRATQGTAGKPSTKLNELQYDQIGAYKIKAVALSAMKILGELTEKPVTMISEGGYYKLRVAGLSGQAEADRLIYGIEHAQKKESVSKTVISERIKKPVAEKKFDYVIQVGAFTQEQNATKVKEELLRITGHPISLILEGGYYKVQVGGFNGWQQAQEFLPKIIEEGYSQAYLKRIKQP